MCVSHTYTHTHIHTHTHTHTYTHTHTHVHTHSCTFFSDVHCGPPDVIENGEFTYKDGIEKNTYMAQITYTCASNYSMKGERVRVCTKNGTWSPIEKPTCLCTYLCVYVVLCVHYFFVYMRVCNFCVCVCMYTFVCT